MKNFTFLLFILTSILVSAQSQITWFPTMDVAGSTYDNLHPRITTDAAGNPVIIWGRLSDDAVFLSRWDGYAFTPPLKLNPSWMTVAVQTWMGPDIAAKGDTVYVVMKQTPEDTGPVYIVTSVDGGATFYDPVQADAIADSISRFPTVAANAGGNPIVAFMKFDPGFENPRWVVTQSNDLGNTFSTDVRASGWSGAGAEVCDCCPGTIVSSGNSVAMLYRDNLGNIRDSWAGISTDGANSFTQGLAIDQNNWMIMMCPSSGPDGVIIGDTLYSTFMNGASGMNMNYFSKSSLTSLNGAPGIELTGMIPGLTSQNYPRIASSGKTVAVAWKQHVDGSDQLNLLFTPNIANGFPAVYDTVDLSNITNTDVAVTPGSVHVVWEESSTGNVKYRRGSFSLSSVVEETTEESLSVYPNPATDFIHVVASMQFIEKIVLTDLPGNEMKVNAQRGNESFYLDITTLRSGTYLLSVYAGHFIKRLKIVVQK